MIRPTPPEVSPPARRRALVIRQLLGCGLALLLLTGCDAAGPFGSGGGGVRFELSLVVISGSGQVVPRGGVESEPLVVRIVDQHNDPFPGFSVDWRVVRGEGTLGAASSVADNDGYARVTYISEDSPGDVEVTATLSVANPDSGSFAGRELPPVSFDFKVN
jgi:hypothetical protein